MSQLMNECWRWLWNSPGYTRSVKKLILLRKEEELIFGNKNLQNCLVATQTLVEKSQSS